MKIDDESVPMHVIAIISLEKSERICFMLQHRSTLIVCNSKIITTSIFLYLNFQL